MYNYLKERIQFAAICYFSPGYIIFPTSGPAVPSGAPLRDRLRFWLLRCWPSNPWEVWAFFVDRKLIVKHVGWVELWNVDECGTSPFLITFHLSHVTVYGLLLVSSHHPLTAIWNFNRNPSDLRKNCKPCWYLVDNQKTVGEKAFKRSFFFQIVDFDSLTLEVILIWRPLYGSNTFVVVCWVLKPKLGWKKPGGCNLKRVNLPSAPCVVPGVTGTGWLVRNRTFPSWTHSWNQRPLQVGIAGDFLWGSLLNPHWVHGSLGKSSKCLTCC